MANDLYFLPLIERALSSSNPKSALIQAFAEIAGLGQRPEYAHGFRQFLHFMAAAQEPADEMTEVLSAQASRLAHDLIIDLAMGTFDGDDVEREAAVRLIQSVDAWEAEYQALLAEVAENDPRTANPTFILSRDGQIVSPADWDGEPLPDMGPGGYIVRLETGRVIWRGELERRQLIWSQAHPGEAFPLAAATEASSTPPTLAVDLPDIGVRIEAYAGIDGGVVGVRPLEG